MAPQSLDDPKIAFSPEIVGELGANAMVVVPILPRRRCGSSTSLVAVRRWESPSLVNSPLLLQYLPPPKTCMLSFSFKNFQRDICANWTTKARVLLLIARILFLAQYLEQVTLIVLKTHVLLMKVLFFKVNIIGQPDTPQIILDYLNFKWGYFHSDHHIIIKYTKCYIFWYEGSFR